MASTSTSGATTTNNIAFTSVANLIRLLPTGTVFIFQFLNPLLTNSGHCQTINKYLSSILISLCGLSCFFSSFTDSYIDSEGKTHYGIATTKGLWPSNGSEDLSTYRLRFGDFVYAFFSLIVFSAVALLNNNTVECFYPSFESTERALLLALPPVFGAISSAVFVLFPIRRHGIGYLSTDSSSSSSSSSSNSSSA